MKNLKAFEDFHDDDFNTKIQPEEFTPEPSMDELEDDFEMDDDKDLSRDLAVEIQKIFDEELYTGPGSHPDSTTVYGEKEAIDRIIKLFGN